MIRVLLCALLMLAALAVPRAEAHEVRPAYLEIRETEAGRYDILWKVPALGAAALPLEIVLPPSCRDLTPRGAVSDGAARVSRWSAGCEGGLGGGQVRVDGLERTMVEAIVRFERLDGGMQTDRLMAGRAHFEPAAASSLAGVAGVYLPLGVDHILLGFDHLCFVLALLLLIRDTRRLIWAITAFTAAHSITLGAATLGYVSLPAGPVEALIAFSIALVAAEVVAVSRGRPSQTAERPWMVAFAFGLLHGLGFAGALSETGLPQDAIPSALLFFNLGVELGQIAFVLAVLALVRLARAAWPVRARAGTLVPAYAIGALAAFWTIERVARIVM